jgi:hypothetical protein
MVIFGGEKRTRENPMTRDASRMFRSKRLLVALALCLPIFFSSCSLFLKKMEYDESPLCKEMRRTCDEYSKYQKITNGKKSQKLDELNEDCYQYSKSCGESIGRVGN